VTQAGLYITESGSVARFAEGLTWLWRLPPVRTVPNPDAVGIGGVEEAGELESRVRAGELAAAIVFVTAPGSAQPPVPASRSVSGVARFAPHARVASEFVVFDSGAPAVKTRRGLHAVRDGRLLIMGVDPEAVWGRMSIVWTLEAIRDLLVDELGWSLMTLPPIGCLRSDDLPGTAQQQLEHREHGDELMARRIRALLRAYEKAGAPLNIAVAARCLKDGEPGEPAPTEEVWPAAFPVLAEGVERGVFEPVCHGFLHYAGNGNPEPDRERGPGRIQPREFAKLDRDQAGRLLDQSMAWMREALGEPHTFVAPSWGYSKGTLEAAAERDLPAWHRAEPAPLIVDGNPRETTIGPGGPGGVHRLDYQILVRMADCGLPPTVAFHGRLFDDRLQTRVKRDALAYARLFVKRDALRVPSLKGVRWLGAGDYVDQLRRHDASAIEGGEPVLPDASHAVKIDRSGRRLVHG